MSNKVLCPDVDSTRLVLPRPETNGTSFKGKVGHTVFHGIFDFGSKKEIPTPSVEEDLRHQMDRKRWSDV